MDETLEGWPNLEYLQALVGEAFRLEESKSPQVVFFGPHPRKKRWPGLGRYSPFTRVPSGRFVKVFWTGENVQPDFSRYDWCFTYDYDEELQHPRHLRRPVWHRDVPLVRTPPTTEKTRFCNFIYSRPAEPREEFFRELSKYQKIDAPGARMNNMQPIGPHPSGHASRYAPDWEMEKIEALRPYKFTIAFENTSRPGYQTEKLYHPMMADSIPIYWGNPLVGRDYNTRSFVNCHDYSSLAQVVERVVEIDRSDELYRKLLSEPWYADGGERLRQHRVCLGERLQEIFASVGR